MSAEMLNSVTSALGNYLAALATVSAVIGALVALALLLTRRAGPRFRHALAFAGLISMVAIPSLTQVGWPNAIQAVNLVRPQSGAQALPERSLHQDVTPATTEPVLPGRIHSPLKGFQGLMASAYPLMAWLWIGGVAILLARHLVSVLYLTKVRRSTSEAPDAVSEMVDEIKQRLAIQKRVSIRHGAHVPVPMVVGFCKPTIIIPTDHLVESRAGLLKAALAHELAHVKGFDNSVGLLVAVCVSALFFNPIAIWLRRVCTLEREFACDDLAVRASQVGRPHYARALAQLQLATAPNSAVSMASSSVVTRVERLVSPGSLVRLRRREFSTLAWILPVTVSVALLVSLGNVAHAQGVAAGQATENAILVGEYRSVLWITSVGSSPETTKGPNGIRPYYAPEVFIVEHTSGKSSGLVHATIEADGLLAQARPTQQPREGEVIAWAQEVLIRHDMVDILRRTVTAPPAGLQVSTFADDGLYVSILTLPRNLTPHQAYEALNSLSQRHHVGIDPDSPGGPDTGVAGTSKQRVWRLANLTMQVAAVGAIGSAQQSQILARLGFPTSGN